MSNQKTPTQAVQLVFVSANRKPECEAELTRLVNEGWVITAAGGGGSSYTTNGFVVLVRDTPAAQNA